MYGFNIKFTSPAVIVDECSMNPADENDGWRASLDGGKFDTRLTGPDTNLYWGVAKR